MKKSLLVAFVVLQAACAGVAPVHPFDAETGPVASPEDFRVVAGSGWKGHLSYLDYSSEALSQIPVEIQVDEPNGRTLGYSIRYPGETQYNSREKIKFSRDGRKVNGGLIIARNSRMLVKLDPLRTIRHVGAMNSRFHRYIDARCCFQK